MVVFIDDYRGVYGVEPICRVLPIAPSTYRAVKADQVDSRRQSARAQRDDVLRGEIQQIWEDNFQVYGARKIWRQLRRDGWAAARCTVERLMRQMGLHGVVRGRTVKTTHADADQPSPADHVKRDFTAAQPNRLWVSDFTFVATRNGFVYVAFVIDVFARRIVGWKAAGAPNTDFVLDALEQAICDRVPGRNAALIHHSDRGVQYLAFRYSKRLSDAEIQPSVGRVGDSYDNALAETVIGLFKTEVIRKRGPWRCLKDVEFATLEWVDWFNHRRLLEPIGNAPPAEVENMYYQQLEESAKAA